METEEKKINYIENPLPLPKKHVKRTMEFRFNDNQKQDKKADDFDVEISDNDDFDI